MKILRIIPSMNPEAGGVAESVRQSAIQMRSENIHIEIVCFDNSDSSWIKDFDFKVYELGKGKTSYAFKASYLSWLNNNIENYDLVIIDGLWMFHVMGGYICKLKKVPYIIYSHGMLDPYFNKDKLKYLKKLPFWFLIERNVIALAKNIVFTCKEEMLLAKKSFPLYKGNGVVATLGIETNKKPKEELRKLFYTKFPHLENTKNILFLSRIHEKKGIDLLIKAIQLMDKKLLKNYKFVLAGTGDKEYINKLKKLIKAKNLENYFAWVGMLKDDMKWAAFASSECFILPSHQENFGIVIAEALSMSIPVLTTNKVNIFHELEEYNAGFIETDSVDGIKSLLNRYLNSNLETIEIIKENSIKCFNEKFSKNAFKNDFIKIINMEL